VRIGGTTHGPEHDRLVYGIDLPAGFTTIHRATETVALVEKMVGTKMGAGGGGQTHGQYVCWSEGVDVDGHSGVSGFGFVIAQNVFALRSNASTLGGCDRALAELAVSIELVQKRHASMHVVTFIRLVAVNGTSNIDDSEIGRLEVMLLLLGRCSAQAVFAEAVQIVAHRVFDVGAFDCATCVSVGLAPVLG